MWPEISILQGGGGREQHTCFVFFVFFVGGRERGRAKRGKT